jgi:hypothetical protein
VWRAGEGAHVATCTRDRVETLLAYVCVQVGRAGVAGGGRGTGQTGRRGGRGEPSGAKKKFATGSGCLATAKHGRDTYDGRENCTTGTTSLEHEQDEEDHDNGDDDEAAYAAQTHCGGMAACERVCFRGASLRADVHFIWSSFLLMSIMRK